MSSSIIRRATKSPAESGLDGAAIYRVALGAEARPDDWQRALMDEEWPQVLSRAHRVGQDGGRHPRLGRTPAACSGHDAAPLGVVPADADPGGANRGFRQGLVRQTGGGGERRRRAARTGRCPCPHGRCRGGELACEAGEPGSARRNPGHAPQPRAHARLRRPPGQLADGVRAAPRRCPVGLRRSPTHGVGSRHVGAARSLSPTRGRARREGATPERSARP